MSKFFPNQKHLLAMGLAFVFAFCGQAVASEVNTLAWTATGAGAQVTMPSGVVVTITPTGATTRQNLTSTPGTDGASAAMFTPSIASTTNGARFLVSGTGCAFNGVCTGRGTIVVTFSQPVTNPVLHLIGIGGITENLSGTTVISSSRLGVMYTLAAAMNGPTSVIASTSLAAPSAGATNLQSTGNVISTIGSQPSSSCNALTGTAATSLAGCGSVQVNGTVTSLTFNIALRVTATVNGGYISQSTSGDGVTWAVSLAQEFSDAPTVNFNVAQAPYHILSDLKFGPTADQDNAAALNPTTSPFPVAVGANNNGSNGDGLDEDALTVFPVLNISATTYSLTLPLTGASKTGTVCGWIDFNRNNGFVATERACATFIAGASDVVLNWNAANSNAPTGLSNGNNYVRLRAGYTNSQIQTADGRGVADSGEIEDYQITVVTVSDLAITKTNTIGSGDSDLVGDTAVSGSITTYTLRATNNGPSTLTGAVVTDLPGAGLTCPPDNSVTVTIAGSGLPAAVFTVANLTGAGIPLGTLTNGQTAIITFLCTVN